MGTAKHLTTFSIKLNASHKEKIEWNIFCLLLFEIYGNPYGKSKISYTFFLLAMLFLAQAQMLLSEIQIYQNLPKIGLTLPDKKGA